MLPDCPPACPLPFFILPENIREKAHFFCTCRKLRRHCVEIADIPPLSDTCPPYTDSCIRMRKQQKASTFLPFMQLAISTS